MNDEETKKTWNEFLEQSRAFREGTRKQYPFPLDQPMFVSRDELPPLPDSGQKVTKRQLEYQERLERELEHRLNLLFMTFRILPDEPSSWEMLARALAEKYVPGCQTTSEYPERKSRGAPKTRGPDFMVQLISAVHSSRERLAREQSKSTEEIKISDAIKKVDDAFLDRWLTSRGRRLSPETLTTRYYEAMKLWEEAAKRPRELGLSDLLHIFSNKPEN